MRKSMKTTNNMFTLDFIYLTKNFVKRLKSPQSKVFLKKSAVCRKNL